MNANYIVKLCLSNLKTKYKKPTNQNVKLKQMNQNLLIINMNPEKYLKVYQNNLTKFKMIKIH